MQRHDLQYVDYRDYALEKERLLLKIKEVKYWFEIFSDVFHHDECCQFSKRQIEALSELAVAIKNFEVTT